MNLDDLSAFQKLDSANMLAEIDDLPDRLARAWILAQSMPAPDGDKLTSIVISAMGASALAAELLAGYASANCRLPIYIHRDYGLPAFARGPKTLFIACDASGNSEETLDAFKQASARDCSILVISTGGRLAEKASLAGYPLWRYAHAEQTGAAFAYVFASLLQVFVRLDLLPSQDELIMDAIKAMKTQQENLRASVPASTNPAKRYAGQLVGRWITFFCSGALAAVARHWKSQINELAKAPANVESLPDANHNSLAGILNPSDELLIPHTLTLFLRAASDHPRNILRANLTRQAFMVEGLNTDFYLAQGESPLAQMWTAIHFGDYMAYYLSIAYGSDPSPLEAFAILKDALAAHP